MNKLLRTVKRRRTVDKLLKGLIPVTIFRKITYGYRQDGRVSNVVVRDITFEVYQGHFMNYQQPLKENQKAVYVGWNKTEAIQDELKNK